jgi:hypothetical protein
VAWFVRRGLVHFHQAGHDHGSGFFPAFSQPLLYEQKVKSDFLFGGHSGVIKKKCRGSSVSPFNKNLSDHQ